MLNLYLDLKSITIVQSLTIPKFKRSEVSGHIWRHTIERIFGVALGPMVTKASGLEGCSYSVYLNS